MLMSRQSYFAPAINGSCVLVRPVDSVLEVSSAFSSSVAGLLAVTLLATLVSGPASVSSTF